MVWMDNPWSVFGGQRHVRLCTEPSKCAALALRHWELKVFGSGAPEMDFGA